MTEIGFFGDVDYERTLTLTEEAAHLAALQRKRQPWIDAAAKNTPSGVSPESNPRAARQHTT